MARLLFFTPVLPCLSGNGSAIRAGIALEVLSEIYEVTVVHVNLWHAQHEVMDEQWVRETAAAYHLVPVPVAPDATRELMSGPLSQVEFDAVYVFRLAVAPLALQVMSLIGTQPPCNALDLDDDECTRTEKFIPLREAAGDFARANHEKGELERLRRLQRMLLSRFSVSLLASPEDRDALAARYPDRKFMLLPNVVRMPATLPALERAPHDSERRNLLFLGSLDYLPNEDAILHFCNAILPLIPSPVSLRIVGAKAPAAVRELDALPGVTFVGAVKDVGTEYARARAMVVPLRAGSGTRIKILEAFSFGVPVVATSAGAAGLGVEHGVHLLIADTPVEFAAACAKLLTDDVLAETLARNAHAWLRSHHTLDKVRDVLHSHFQERV